MLGYDTLMNHFKTNFALQQHHGWNLAYMDTMMPWERQVYIDLLKAHLREEEQRMRDRAVGQPKTIQSPMMRR